MQFALSSAAVHLVVAQCTPVENVKTI